MAPVEKKCGFRAYSISLHHKMERNRCDWDDLKPTPLSSPLTYMAHFRDVWNRLSNGRNSSTTTDPRWPVGAGIRVIANLTTVEDLPTADEDKEAVVAGTGFSVDPDNRIHIKINTGVNGSYPSTLGPSGREPLTGGTPSQDFRAILVPGEADGLGIAIIETIGRFCPVVTLHRLLAMGSRLQTTQNSALSPNWWQVKFTQIADPKFLEELLKRGKPTVVLRRSRRDGSGDRRRKDMELTAQVRCPGNLRRWLKSAQKHGYTRGGVRGLIELINEKSLDKTGFTDGCVKLGDGENSTTIPLGSFDPGAFFTYPVGNNPISDDIWNSKTIQKIDELWPELEDN